MTPAILIGPGICRNSVLDWALVLLNFLAMGWGCQMLRGGLTP